MLFHTLIAAGVDVALAEIAEIAEIVAEAPQIMPAPPSPTQRDDFPLSASIGIVFFGREQAYAGKH